MPETREQVPPQNVSALISSIRKSLQTQQVSELTKLDPLTEAHVDDKKTDTRLKKLYAYWFIGILIGQLLVMNGIFVLVGLDMLRFSEPTHLNLFMGGTLAEVFGVVFVITRYLFSKK